MVPACGAVPAGCAGPEVALARMTSVAGQGALLAGRYRLDAPVAAGGGGQVWRAVDLLLGRAVAVKVLRPDAAGDPEARDRFHAEACHASRLSHPGVAQVYDFGEDGSADRPFLVMELVDGPSLAQVLAGGPLGPGRTVDLIAQAAAGLQAAHSAGMVHRDIKPANLLITADGQVKITDFGIASLTRDAPLTSSGILVGTPAYLAPERAAGKPATSASDLYSLGVVGYECLTGAPPFRGSALEVAESHVTTPFPALPATVPAEVGALIAALTAKDPGTRPASAREVAEQAGRLLAAERIIWPGAISLPPGASDPLTAGPLTLADARTTQAYQPAFSREAVARRARARPGKAAAGLAAAAVLTAAGLAGWQASLAGAARHHGTVVVPRRPASPAAPMVLVRSARLDGQQVSIVLADLRRQDLRPRLSWVPTSSRPPGTVLSVYPDGPLPPGTVVQVTAAQPAQQAGQSGDRGDGGGGGDGNGGGDGGRGSDGGGGNGD